MHPSGQQGHGAPHHPHGLPGHPHVQAHPYPPQPPMQQQQQQHGRGYPSWSQVPHNAGQQPHPNQQWYDEMVGTPMSHPSANDWQLGGAANDGFNPSSAGYRGQGERSAANQQLGFPGGQPPNRHPAQRGIGNAPGVGVAPNYYPNRGPGRPPAVPGGDDSPKRLMEMEFDGGNRQNLPVQFPGARSNQAQQKVQSLTITQQPLTSDPSGFKEPVVLLLKRPAPTDGSQQHLELAIRNEYFVRVELLICGWKEAKRARCSSSATASEFGIGLAPKEIRGTHLKGTLMQRVQADGTVTFDDLRITLTTAKMRKHAAVDNLRISSANYCLGFQLVACGEVVLREMVLTKPIAVVHRTTIWRNEKCKGRVGGPEEKVGKSKGAPLFAHLKFFSDCGCRCLFGNLARSSVRVRR